MTEYRLARPEEENDILDFINFVFSQAHRPHDFRALLPKVYAHPGFSQYHVVAVENGRIRGTVALLPLTLRVSGGDTLSVGYIGSVSAHPYDKGAGHMKKLMNLTLENAEKAGYDLLTLGGQRQRYAYFGFERAEMHRTFRLRTPNVRHALRDVDASAVIIREIQAGDEDLIAAAYALSSAQDMTCLRDRARYLDIMHSWCNRLYAVLDAATGAFEGYLNVSDDYIAEMALVREERLPQVLKAWHQAHGDVTVNVPAHLPARAGAQALCGILRAGRRRYASPDASRAGAGRGAAAQAPAVFPAEGPRDGGDCGHGAPCAGGDGGWRQRGGNGRYSRLYPDPAGGDGDVFLALRRRGNDRSAAGGVAAAAAGRCLAGRLLIAKGVRFEIYPTARSAFACF